LKTKIIDFQNFISLSYGDTVDQVFDVFGVPHEEYRNDENTYFVFYYRQNSEIVLSISFSVHSFRIESVFLGLNSIKRVRSFLSKHEITECQTSFIGHSLDEIYDYFGVPDDIAKNYISYKMHHMEVEFYCPTDERSLCKRIKVKWFY
jgi:hypothetical protein